MKLTYNFTIILFLTFLGTNSYADILKIKCENDWWNVVIDKNTITINS